MIVNASVASGSRRWVLAVGAGCRVLAVGCWVWVWVLGAGCWVLVAGCWVLVLVLLSHGKPTPFFYALSCTLTGAVAKFLPVLVVLPVGAGAGAGLFW
jgi:hypothetical protein